MRMISLPPDIADGGGYLIDGFMTPEEVSDHLAVMTLQEEKIYHCNDYLAINAKLLKRAHDPINEDCRIQVCEWCFPLFDSCQFRRETVGRGLSYLDRFLCTREGREALLNQRVYQLAAMTSLFLAVKLHEPEQVRTSQMVKMSQNVFTRKDFLCMEIKILMAIRWNLNGPTSLNFVQYLLALLPKSTKKSLVAEALMNYARYQTEVAVTQHSLITYKPSQIALAAVFNAIESMDITMFPTRHRRRFRRAIDTYSGLRTDHVAKIRPQISALHQMSLAKVGDDAWLSSGQDGGEFSKSPKSQQRKSHKLSPSSVARH